MFKLKEKASGLWVSCHGNENGYHRTEIRAHEVGLDGERSENNDESIHWPHQESSWEVLRQKWKK